MLILICSFLIPAPAQAEKIRGHFNRLPLMREIALQERNKRAIKNIDYISETPEGEFFEVDNSNPPIESLVYKTDKTKQRKPLDEVKDEILIIYYYHKVDNFAEDYYRVVDPMITGMATPEQAKSTLQGLRMKYSGFGAPLRALGASAIASGDAYEGVRWTKEAVSMNSNDSKALLLLSIGEYALGYTDASTKYLKDAMYIEPRVTCNSWEIQYVEENNPKVFKAWFKDVAKSSVK
jgi:hypothetical protein